MKPNIAPELSAIGILGSANDHEPLSDLPGDDGEFSDVPHPLDKLLEASKLAAATNLGRSAAERLVHNFALQSAPLDTAVAVHYKKLAASATKKEPVTPAGDPHRMEKRARRVVAGDANDTRKVARTDVTKYSTGKILTAEIAEDGEVIRVVEEFA